MEEEKGERGERKQRASEENNRNDLTERRRRFVMKLLQISSSTFLILHHFSAFYFQLHVVTTFCEWSGSVYAQKPLKKRSCLVGSVDTNTTGRCPDASLTDWIFLRTFADIFLCRQIWMFLRNTGTATKTVVLLFSSGHVTSTSCLLCGLFFSFSSLQSRV